MRGPKILVVALIALAALASLAWAVGGGDDGSTDDDEAAAPTTAGDQPPDGRVTEPLREEHKELIPHITGLAEAADGIGVAPLDEQRDAVHESYVFLTEQLIPHAVAEDEVLYLEIDELIGTRGETRAADTMRRDHEAVGALTDRLGELGDVLHEGELDTAQQTELRSTLYGLHHVVDLHFAKEEEVFLPLLDRELTADEAQEMFEEMEAVTVDAGGAEHGH
jgi:iron-sulfur cluster repair protein YtfE (RIC family)